MITHYTLSRRNFLRCAGTFAAVAGLSPFSLMNAFAQSTTDYKALVCIFLMGGNDGHNILVPQTPEAYNAYQSIRGPLALPDTNAGLLPISDQHGTPYGLNDGLASIAPLWTQQKLAVVANVGMLVQPTSRMQYLAKTVPVPTNLFSHVDQILQMQAGNPNGLGGTGWAGRVADAVQGLNGSSSFPASISMAGSALFCTGSVVQSASLIPGFDLTLDGMTAWPASAAAAKQQALQEILTFDTGLTLVQAANKVRQDAIALNGMLKSLNASTPLTTVFPQTDIGRQLQQVAQIIRLRTATGMKRQVFFCSLGGFDTHSGQSWAQWDLLRQVSDGMIALYNASVEMGVAEQVTTFTESDFGRTLQPSGTGSDHGWGNHHLIMGGTVNGGDVYGIFPSLALGGPDDASTRGILIPTTSMDQYGATLAKWFGVSAAAMPQIFPNLANFSTADLGFLG
ncbi:MAG: DUF1501 domain-containing protein [Gammaproteobacteria bacterium]|nr:DUF1501 domain-containing protein [Gammaproteobacteria bacterium]